MTERHKFTTNDGTVLIVYIKHDKNDAYWYWFNFANIGVNCIYGTSFGTGDQYYSNEVAAFVNSCD